MSVIVLLVVLIEQEIGPAGVFRIQVLLSPVLESQSLIDPVRRRIGSQGIKADRLHPAALRQGDGLADHLRAEALALPIRSDGEDMDDGHLVVGN